MYEEDCFDDYNDDYEEVRIMLICCIVCRLVVSIWNSWRVWISVANLL